MVSLRLEATCHHTGARAGELVTPHGTIPTPAFAPVASIGVVKTLSPKELKGVGVGVLLANAYHLMLRPGLEVISALGGLHRFMAWDGPVVTDSGGYQVFSLARLVRVGEEGVLFRSHIDGSQQSLSPEAAVALQEGLGADIMMVLDQPTPYGAGRDAVATAAQRTGRWAERCLGARQGRGELWAIVQGGTFTDLRRESASHMASLGFPGYAIGGLSLGESREVMWGMVEASVAPLPPASPRYLMGVGSPEELVEAVARGVDLLDSALPTRIARNGSLFTRRGRINITNSRFQGRESPVEDGCPCYLCRTYSAAYLSHLFRTGETLGLRLATLHNLTFLQRLMAEMRMVIQDGGFSRFREGFLAGYRPTDEAVRLARRRRAGKGE
ncbi:MAG: tRNA guanosine(34) transglycosylase Tgt [Dehalococcoidia bacterium]|nr:tRNA guanosine(34) transglycosylase Tgt [Dehalococcoidia bacterium]